MYFALVPYLNLIDFLLILLFTLLKPHLLFIHSIDEYIKFLIH